MNKKKENRETRLKTIKEKKSDKVRNECLLTGKRGKDGKGKGKSDVK